MADHHMQTAGQLLEQAFSTLASETGVRITDLVNDAYRSSDSGAGSVSELRETGPMSDYTAKVVIGGRAHDYVVEVKPHCHSATLQRIRHLHETLGDRLLFVTQRVTPGLADILRREGIQFADTAGNAYLSRPGLHLFVRGLVPKAIPEPEAGEMPLRLDQPAGLKVTFVYLARLCMPGTDLSSRAFPLVELAKAAGVSLGSASNARRELERAGYLATHSDGTYEISDAQRLVDKWLRGHAARLVPKVTLGRVHARLPRYWEKIALPHDTAWSGEPAAALLTRHLAPERGILYVRDWPHAALSGLGLSYDENGEIEVRDMFWHDPGFTQNTCVHPLLVYADLWASEHARNLETAEIIYARDLAQYFKS